MLKDTFGHNVFFWTLGGGILVYAKLHGFNLVGQACK